MDSDMRTYLHALTTEEVNPLTRGVDSFSTEEIVRCINEQDQGVALAIREELPQIARAVDVIYERLRGGGRLFYVGAGTSGRLGVLDASECPPTYGTSPEMVQGIIAGGDRALRNAIEGAEDDEQAGAALIEQYGMNERDVLAGITASGSARFVLGAARAARAKGLAVIGIVNNRGTLLEGLCDVCIAPIVGPEVIVGSTRMKAGTAAKMVLNMLTTSVMIKLGKVYGNLMVDLRATNKKLKDRAVRIVSLSTGLGYDEALAFLSQADGETKTAILMAKTGVDAPQSRRLLEQAQGVLRTAIAMAGARRAE